MTNAQTRRAAGNGFADWPNGFDMMLAMQRPALEAMTAINSRFLEQIQEVNSAWSSFVQTRVREDMAMPQQLASCQSVQDLMRVYGDFLQKAARQYQAEFAHMARMGQAFTTETAGIVREKAEGAAREVKH